MFPKELQPNGEEKIDLPNGESVFLPMCNQTFELWSGPPVAFDYGGKPILDFNGKPCFAELAILQLLLGSGWEGVWIESYGGVHFLRDMPQKWSLKAGNVEIPPDKKLLLERIWKAGETTACFDVCAWHDDQTCFFEAKRSGKDRLTGAQLKFIKGALKCNISPESLIIVEWTA